MNAQISTSNAYGPDRKIELGMRLELWFQEHPNVESLDAVAALRTEFGVSRATAYRYIQAHRRAHGTAP